MNITPELITQFGLINKISTGNTVLDMVLCLLVPILLKEFVPYLNSVWTWIFSVRGTVKKTVTRQIEYTRRTNYWDYYSNDQPPNSLLQRAIINYINTFPHVMKGLPEADYQLEKAKDEKPAGSDDEGASSNEQRYKVNTAPAFTTWIDLDNGLRFMRESETADEKAKNFTTRFHLETSEKDGNAKIDAFVEKALDLYHKQQAAKVDHSRYLYIPVLSGFLRISSEGENSKPAALYKRYKLSEEKTFASFFHPEKQTIQMLVDQFLQKKGKFSIPGYPQKLGFLLYGPPGTGKTSFIKALSQYTKRSIISIPLTKISTNQELMDIMFDQKIQVEGEECTNLLPFSKTIFVMEDVDAASNVVHRRDGAASAAHEAMLERRMKSLMKAKSQNKSQNAEGSVKGDGEIKEDAGDDGPVSSKKMGPHLPVFMGRSLFGDDELNLAGLLNVLDGVVDTPNRIIIMTTNHPEKLDPALIRPGRINKKIYLGRMRVEQAESMMEHYFGPVPVPVREHLYRVFVDEVLSPAELEAMCADYETPAELVEHLELRFQARAMVPVQEPAAAESAAASVEARTPDDAVSCVDVEQAVETVDPDAEGEAEVGSPSEGTCAGSVVDVQLNVGTVVEEEKKVVRVEIVAVE